jgi:hypothetical protein
MLAKWPRSIVEKYMPRRREGGSEGGREGRREEGREGC